MSASADNSSGRGTECSTSCPRRCGNRPCWRSPSFGLELWAAAKLEHLDEEARPPKGSYSPRDTQASLLMGVLSIGTSAVTKVIALLAYTAIFAYLAPWQLPLPLLGIPAAVVFAVYSLNLIYQSGVHTERVDRLWRPVEFVMNTHSHHRVHHGRDPEHLDRNYGGVVIVWDRVFGSFAGETFRSTYDLTTPVGTYNIVTLQTYEDLSLARDVAGADRLRDKLGYVFGPPGWAPRALTDR